MQFGRAKIRYTPSLDITPLIDVVFLLLVFLLLTMTFSQDKSRVEEAIIEIELAQSSTHADPTPKASVQITIDENGRIYHGESAVAQTDESLKLYLSESYVAHPELSVNIRADKRARHGDIVRALDIVKGLGINHVQLVIEFENAHSTP